MRCLNSLSKLHLLFSLKTYSIQAFHPPYVLEIAHFEVASDLDFVQSNGHWFTSSSKHFFHLTSRTAQPPDFPPHTLAVSFYSFLITPNSINIGAQFLVLFFISTPWVLDTMYLYMMTTPKVLSPAQPSPQMSRFRWLSSDILKIST